MQADGIGLTRLEWALTVAEYAGAAYLERAPASRRGEEFGMRKELQ